MKNNHCVFAYEIYGKLVDFIATIGRYVPIPQALSTTLCCTICKGTDHYAPYVFDHVIGQDTNSQRVWVCGNPNCDTMKKENIPTHLPLKKK